MAFVLAFPPVVFAFSALGYATYRYAKKEETSSPSLFIIDERCNNIAREALFACKSSPSLRAAKAAGAAITGGDDDDVARLGRILEKASCEDEYKVALKKCTSH